jgi:Ran GTPase-activating protein (RanGAP) involved in mRNA processing and transport
MMQHASAGAEPDTPLTFDLAPVLAALRHNTYFYSVSLSGIIRPNMFSLLGNTMQTNAHLTKLNLSNLGKLSSVQLLFEAMQKNSANALQVLDLSGTIVNDKSMAALAGAIAIKEYGLQALLLARSGISNKGLTALVRDGFERNPAVALSLQHLVLSFNSFDESSSILLQSWFSRMSEHSNMRQLELEKCGLNLMFVTRPLHSFVKLRHIDVSSNRIDTGTCQLLCTIAELTSTLTTYNMANCSLSADFACAIVKCIVSNQRLTNTRIDLSGNALNARAIDLLARVLVANNINLGAIDLSRNQLTDESLLALCAALQKMERGASSLDTLILNELPLSNTSGTSGSRVAQAIVATLNSVPSIKCLSLCGGLPLAIAVPLLHLLHTNHSLLELRIEDNKLGDAGAAAIATMLRTNQTLGKLCIDGNAIGISGWHAIRSAFLHNRTLQVLDFSWVDLHKTLAPLPMAKRSLARTDLLEIHCAVRINQHLAGGLAERFRPSKPAIPTVRLAPCPVPESMLQATGPIDLTPSTDTSATRPTVASEYDSYSSDLSMLNNNSSSSTSTYNSTTTSSYASNLPPEPAHQPPVPPTSSSTATTSSRTVVVLAHDPSSNAAPPPPPPSTMPTNSNSSMYQSHLQSQSQYAYLTSPYATHTQSLANDTSPASSSLPPAPYSSSIYSPYSATTTTSSSSMLPATSSSSPPSSSSSLPDAADSEYDSSTTGTQCDYSALEPQPPPMPFHPTYTTAMASPAQDLYSSPVYSSQQSSATSHEASEAYSMYSTESAEYNGNHYGADGGAGAAPVRGSTPPPLPPRED